MDRLLEELLASGEVPVTARRTQSVDSTLHSESSAMDIEAQSLSEGAGSDERMRVHRVLRRRVGGNNQVQRGRLGRKKTYECDVCMRTFTSPQSLGGHKNLHSGKKSKKSQHHRGSSSSSEGVPGYKGVRCREGTKWVSEIRPPRSSEKWWLGTFGSAEEAAVAYDVALCYFKSDSERNFDVHELCLALPVIDSDLSSNEFASRLRKMLREVSGQIIASRRGGTHPAPIEEAAPISLDSPTAGASSSHTDPEQVEEEPAPPTLDFPTAGASPSSHTDLPMEEAPPIQDSPASSGSIAAELPDMPQTFLEFDPFTFLDC